MSDIFSAGEWLRRRRKALDLTQDELAERVGCSKELIAKIEQDARRPSKQIAELLAVQLQLTVDEQPLFVQALRAELAIDRMPNPTANLPRPMLLAQTPQPLMATATDHAPGNLPHVTNTIIGRSGESSSICRCFETMRLVTLTGVGGTGRTRLALEVGRLLQPQHRDGIWFIDLSAMTQVEQLIPAIIHALSLPDGGNQPLLNRLHAWLDGKHVMLIVDNCEQVVADCAALITLLLQRHASLHILVTSRIPLRIAGEQEYALAPLAVPPHGEVAALELHDTSAVDARAERISQFAAVALFIARARAVRHDFVLTMANAVAVAEICIQLDGLPLAIELAAARIRMFTLEMLLERLKTSRMQLLSGGARDAPTRQQTIRATIAWSYDMLSASGQALFMRLGVFVGGWTLEAAEVVCGDGQFDTISEMEQLIEHSLVRRRDHVPEPHYMMLETLREYAVALIREQNLEAMLRERHAEYLEAFALRAAPHLERATQREWLDRLEQMVDNLRAALDWSFTTGKFDRAARIAVSTSLFWDLRDHVREGRDWLKRLSSDEAISQLSPALRPRVRLALVVISTGHSAEVLPMAQLAQQAIREFEAIGDVGGHAAACVEAGYIEAYAIYRNWMADTTTAEQLLLHGLELLEENTLALRAKAHAGFGLIAAHRADLETARVQFEESIRLARALGDARSVAWYTFFLSLGEQWMGDLRAALRWQTERYDAESALGHEQGLGDVYAALAWLEFQLGHFEHAAHLFRNAIISFQRIGSTTIVAECRTDYALLLLWNGKYQDVVEYLAHTSAAYPIATSISSLRTQYRLMRQGEIAYALGNVPAAYGVLESLVQDSRKQLQPPELSPTLQLFGMVLFRMGRYDDAIAHLTEAIALIEHDRSQMDSIARNKGALGRALAAGPTPDQAIPLLRTSLQFIAHSHSRIDGLPVLEASAMLAARLGDASTAAALWGAAAETRTQLGAPLWPVDRPEYERSVAEARSQITSAAWEQAWAAGIALTWEQAVDMALAWLASIRTTT
jgi:predicted ATPase/transcriptional regulator with XRE-family HTH domain